LLDDERREDLLVFVCLLLKRRSKKWFGWFFPGATYILKQSSFVCVLNCFCTGAKKEMVVARHDYLGAAGEHLFCFVCFVAFVIISFVGL
jgi:hypothetical protein